jgi:hypothetical protein
MQENKDTSTRETLRDALAAELAERGTEGPHPDAEMLRAYRGDALENEHEEAVRRHLLTCPRCLEDFFALEGEEVPPPSEFERAAAWRALRSRLPAPGPPLRSRWVERWAALFLCALLAAYCAWTTLEIRELSQPQLDSVIWDVLPGEERGGASPEEISWKPGGQLNLVLPYPGEGTYSRHGVEVLGPGGKTWRSGPRILAVELETWILTLPARYVEPGEIRIRLYGLLPSGERELLGEWTREIELQGAAEGD